MKESFPVKEPTYFPYHLPSFQFPIGLMQYKHSRRQYWNINQIKGSKLALRIEITHKHKYHPAISRTNPGLITSPLHFLNPISTNNSPGSAYVSQSC